MNSITRRNFIHQLGAGATGIALTASAINSASAQGAALTQSSSEQPSGKPAKKPNIVIFHTDQFRHDFVCAAGQSPMDCTPNLDAMYRRSTVFQNFITNQPLCAPSRACLMTGQYATTAGVWKNGLGLHPNANTIATALTESGYTANYIGKWHLAPNDKVGAGAVPPAYRGGFTGYWLAANAPEISTLPYGSHFWDNDGNPVPYDKDTYRVEFVTEKAEAFLRQEHDKPFLLVISQLEPHQQNGDWDGDEYGFAPPRGYADQFRSPYVPPDLKFFPGDWPYELKKYYGDVKAIDESFGRIVKTLKEQNLEEDTVVIFMSDHACHFRTRNQEYKRSPHESSIHVPLMIQGPGFNRRQLIPELVSMIDLTPSILDAVGVPIPSSMQGKSFIPLLRDEKARDNWVNEVFIQISEAETARALRTPEFTYCALAPDANPEHDSGSLHYRDYQLYDNRADPYQLVNLAGRLDTRWPTKILLHHVGDRSMEEITANLRQRLIERMVQAGETRPEISHWPYYP